MGIDGLWDSFKPHRTAENLSIFSGKRVAVDMFVWLHKCTYGCVDTDMGKLAAYFESRHSSCRTECCAPPAATAAPLPPPPPPPSSAAAAVPPATTDTPPSPTRATLAAPPTAEQVLTVNETELVRRIVKRVRTLRTKFGIRVVCVFDGQLPPMKSATREDRQSTRERTFMSAVDELERLYCKKRRAATAAADDAQSTLQPRAQPQRRPERLLPESDAEVKKQLSKLNSAVRIAPELARRVLLAVKAEGAECIVAPYEADPQMAYLCRTGYVAAVITVDSDLIAYLCPCIVRDYKDELNLETGSCWVLRTLECMADVMPTLGLKREVARRQSAPPRWGDAVGTASNAAALQRDLLRCVYGLSDSVPADVSFPAGFELGEPRDNGAALFTYETFLLGCIVSGCDYTDGVPGLGIKKAFEKVLNGRSFDSLVDTVGEERRRSILDAFYAFTHHIVYSPMLEELALYRPLPAVPSRFIKAGERLELKTAVVGEKWAAATARGVCAAHLLSPHTLQPYS